MWALKPMKEKKWRNTESKTGLSNDLTTYSEP